MTDDLTPERIEELSVSLGAIVRDIIEAYRVQDIDRIQRGLESAIAQDGDRAMFALCWTFGSYPTLLAQPQDGHLARMAVFDSGGNQVDPDSLAADPTARGMVCAMRFAAAAVNRDLPTGHALFNVVDDPAAQAQFLHTLVRLASDVDRQVKARQS